jgi:hypothetical protein
MADFDREVSRIGRRKAISFFAWRLFWILFAIYMAVAAYGRYHGATP